MNHILDTMVENLQAAASFYDNREVLPRYPYHLVRQLPRANVLRQSGLLLLNQQGTGGGKPVAEGIVIRTWEELSPNDPKPDVAPGDLVIYPHWHFHPVVPEDETYIFVPERKVGDTTAAGIMGVFKHSDLEIRSQLYKMPGIAETESSGDLIDLILTHYDLIPKKVNPRTRIG